MKVFVAGSMGFIGRSVSEAFEAQNHIVFRGGRSTGDTSIVNVDLLDPNQVQQVLDEVRPDIVINCAGVIDRNSDFENNVRMSRNLLEAIGAAGLKLHRFVLCGSAGEYGFVDSKYWPVSENTPLLAENPYALSKVREEAAVRELAELYQIDAVIARIFNPIGTNMPAKFLVSNILEQIQKINYKEADEIVVSRLDALRDYIDIKDLARAIVLMATQEHRYDTYNIGSGKSTSTSSLLRCILEESGVSESLKTRELADEPERPVASQADISRLRDDFNWTPEIPFRETIKGVVNHE